MRTAVFAVLLVFAEGLTAQVLSDEAARKITAAITAKAAEAKEYAFEADLVLEGQRGDGPGTLMAKAKVKLAAAPGGKFYLRLQPVDKDEYLLVSDGQKSWAFVPKLKQYTEEEAGVLLDTGAEEDEGGSDDEKDLAEVFSRQAISILKDMMKTASSLGVVDTANVKYEGKKYKWPVIRVMSRREANGSLNMTELTVDPEALHIARLVFASVEYRGNEKTLVRLTMNFDSFRLGENVDQTVFAFDAGKAKLVEAVPIPGQTGSFLLNKPAPDLELKTLDGEKVKLSELRDKPVLLNFWASWCGPCRRELPSLTKIYDELGPKGLVVFGINDEGRGTAKRFAEKAGLSFPTLDDSGLKAHRLYKVKSIPTVFLIDKQGKVVKFFRGAKDEAALRAALKSVGF